MRVWITAAVLLTGCGLLVELDPDQGQGPAQTDAAAPATDAGQTVEDAGAVVDGGPPDASGSFDAGPRAAPPTIIDLRVFSDGLAALDAVGDDPSPPVPWPIDHLKLHYSEPMVDADLDAVLRDATNTIAVTVRPILSDPDYFFEISRADGAGLADGYYCLTVPASASRRGLLLDGEWTGAFPSGDGFEGGDFVFELAVLHGDVNRNGIVDAADSVAIRNNMGSTEQPAADLDGSGTVDGADYLIWMRRFGNFLRDDPMARAPCP